MMGIGINRFANYLYGLTLLVALLYFGSGSMLIQFKLGPLSLSAWTTILVGLSFVLILILKFTNKGISKLLIQLRFEDRILFFTCCSFLLYAGVSVVFSRNIEGFQNLISESLFFIGIIVFAFNNNQQNSTKIWDLVVYVSGIHALFMIATKFVNHDFIDNRSYAMVSIFGLIAAVFSSKRNLFLYASQFIIFVSILLSASRTASLAAAIVMSFVFVQFSAPKIRVAWQLILGIIFSVLTSIVIYTLYKPSASRIVTGDQAISIPLPATNSSIAGSVFTNIQNQSAITINTNGRIEAWLEFLSRLVQPSDWIFGLGTGSSAQYGRENIPFFPQVLNEYLRVLIDNGIVGLLLLLSAIGSIVFKLVKSKRICNPGRLAAGFACILTLLVISLTDGAFVYPFSSLPAALLIGLTLQPSFEELFTSRISREK